MTAIERHNAADIETQKLFPTLDKESAVYQAAWKEFCRIIAEDAAPKQDKPRVLSMRSDAILSRSYPLMSDEIGYQVTGA